MKYFKSALLSIAIVTLVALTAGCCCHTSASGDSSSGYTQPSVVKVPAAPTGVSTKAPTPVPTAKPTATPIPAISLSGNGQQASDKFYLEKGLVIFNMKHNGNSNFIVHMLNDQGKTEEYLANEIGDYDGSVVIGTTKAGYYLLDIDADGPWTVDIDQPRPTTAQQVPISMSGTGPQASEFFYLKQGLTTFKLNHNGESNFIVHLVDSKGNTEEYLVNEIGEFDGSKAIGVSKSGVYLISVDADGDWTISVK